MGPLGGSLIDQTTRPDCAVIALSHVTREYSGHAGVVRALADARFSIVAGSGSQYRAVGFEEHASEFDWLPGSANVWELIDNVDVASMSATELDRFRADKIGFIFQQFHLIPYLSAVENVMLAQYFHSMTDEAEARAALEKVGLADRVSHLPSELSGGEQQRVCIARALINNPPILLADEPTGNLDAANQAIVAELLQDLHRNGHTIVMVTHDPEMAGLAQRKVR
jgi:putative ABC transport system ATP-binding protein